MIRAAYVGTNYMKDFTSDDANMLDVINIAFGLVRENSLYFPENGVKTEFDRVRTASPDLKIILSVGGWGAGGFSHMASTEEGRLTFARSCRDVVDQYGFDGIDIDWEYPTKDWAGIDASPDDRENFTLMLRELRRVLPESEGKLLTIAVGCGTYYPDCVEFEKIVPLLDYISLMSYDMRGIGSTAGHHTGLYPTTGDENQSSADTYVKLFTKCGVPAEKQILGAALYSRIWKGVPDAGVHGLGQAGSEGSGGFGPGYTELKNDYINQNGYVLYRDNSAPFLYKAETGEFISFDDPDSAYAKVNYILDNGLAGIMYWEHSCDKEREILKAINQAVSDSKNRT